MYMNRKREIVGWSCVKGGRGGEAIGPEVKGEMGACSKKRGHEGRGRGG